MPSEYVTFEDLVRFHREVIAPDLDARMDAKLAPMARQIVSLETRMEEGFNTLHEAIMNTRREMHAGFDDLYSRFDELSVDFVAMKGGLRRVETRTDALESRTGVLEERVTRVERKRRS
jgi:hypothetical protein